MNQIKCLENNLKFFEEIWSDTVLELQSDINFMNSLYQFRV